VRMICCVIFSYSLSQIVHIYPTLTMSESSEQSRVSASIASDETTEEVRELREMTEEVHLCSAYLGPCGPE
jgi:hypothetical protein